MATSRTAQALSDLVDLVQDRFDDQPARDDDKALLDNANVHLDEYSVAERDPMDQVGDQVRMYLARIVQMVNQRYPDLTSTREMREALDILANPHGDGGVATMSNRGVPTPFAEEPDSADRREPVAARIDQRNEDTRTPEDKL